MNELSRSGGKRLAVLIGFYDEVEVGGSFVCGHPRA